MNTEMVEELIEQAYGRLKELDVVSALELFKKALGIDYEHLEVKYGLKCVNWWLERVKRLDDIHESYEKGEYIITQWKAFYAFLDQIGEADDNIHKDSCQYAFRCYAFSLALSFFADVYTSAGNPPDPELLFQIGRCYKGLGNYEEAVKYLEQTIRFKPEESGALAELADVNALLGDPRAAKVLFREAFFLDPQGINLWSMESDMIIRLGQKVMEFGYEGRELAEWIPVYGALWGVFSVRRELKPIEISRLKQSIYTLETESENLPGGNFVKPRLLNRYFRLIDHYGTSSGGLRDNSDLVEDTMRKIKLIDPAIYEQYRN